MPKAPRANGAVIYNGPSRINGDPIIVVIVWRSTNKKPGDVAQVYIIREDKHPVEALRDNTDDAICGNCPLRYTFNPVTEKWERECYVNEGFGPANVYKEYKNGKYPAMSPTGAGLILRDMRQGARLGAYGDPAAVDISIWQKLVTTSGTLTLGYTHQWKNPYFQPELLEYAMASIDHENTVGQFREIYPNARYYRIRKPDEELLDWEIECPHDEYGVQCETCGLCDPRIRAKNIAVKEIPMKGK